METAKLHPLLASIVLLVALLRAFLTLPNDPDMCNSLLTTGSYLKTAPSWQWQPHGCMTRDYALHPNAKTLGNVKNCLGGRQLVFVGDSTVRDVFFGMARVVDPEFVEVSDDEEFKHSDRTVVSEGIRMTFHWDPFLNTTKTYDILAGSPPSASVPTLAVFGTGLWYLRQSATFEAGGIAAFKEHTTTLFQQFSASSTNVVADQIVFMPVLHVWEDLLNPSRRETISNDDISMLNSHLSTLDESLPNTPGIAHAFNLLLSDEGRKAETEDGMHYPLRLGEATKLQANILYNLRCNEFLPPLVPVEPTCCREYPRANGWQTIIIVLFVVGSGYGALLYLSSLHSNSRAQGAEASQLSKREALWISASIFAAALLYCYAADRTHLFLKESKSFSRLAVGFWLLAVLVAGVHWRKEVGKDLGFLNREQTDEWKGWMQIVILVYHWFGASGTLGIYNPVRVLVAAYLFMTGYGHATFYYKKKEFKFKRVLSVLVRLNLLAVGMVYVLDTDYLSLYFSPLVSMHYLFIFAIMRVGSSLNASLPFLLFKILLASLLLTALFTSLSPLETIFSLSSTLFSTHWLAREWQFRTVLDLYAPYAGMVVAFLGVTVEEYKLKERESWAQIRKATLALSVMGMTWYFWFELTRTSKEEYNAYHPYISIIPILSFVFLRNATSYLRGTTSVLFAYFGKISLETFMLQFNIWLAGDTKGLLLIFPFLDARWRQLNFVLSSLVFVWVSEKVAKATGRLTDFLCEEWKGGTAEPNVLPTTGMATEKLELEVGTAEGLGRGRGWLEKCWRSVKTDLRARTVAIFVALTILNHLWPNRTLEAHILPTH
ncbi:Cas1p-domain-containing protein [Atractiella rhizophila]|nr:Cas1p-domain-containing protein [Atractiella rhizophila]